MAVIGGLAAMAAVAIAARQPSGARLGAGSVTRRPLAFSRHSLAPAHGALFGAWVQPATSYTLAGEESAVTGLEHAIGRKLAIDQIYVQWGAPMPLPFVRWDLRHGNIPMISLSGARTDRIAAGAYDAQIRAFALQLRDLHAPVMLRWFAEMTLPQNRADAVSPASFIAAWRHMHNIFMSVGAANVRWVWCPSASDFTTGTAQRFYPDNPYVDWIGADGYNWAPELPHVRWRSFSEIFSQAYRWGLLTGRPILIGEFGVLEGAPGAKGAWFRQADRQLRSQFPAIRALVYFDSDHPDFGRHFDWKVTSSPSALAGFRAFATDPYFSARPATHV